MAMAEATSIEPDKFEFTLQWPASPEAGGNPVLDASLSRFEIKAGPICLTSYLRDDGSKNSFLTVPAYYLVEWLAQNWWAFLYEPRKDDRDGAAVEFRSRHWLGFPRNGFALPDAMFSPSGDTIEITARQTYLRFAQLSFTEQGTSVVSTHAVREQFFGFISAVLEQMKAAGVKNTEAHQAWRRVLDTSKDEETYCRLLGSMGLSPYVEHPEIDKALDSISDLLTDEVMQDLCEAASIASFRRTAEFAGKISEALDKSDEIEFQPLFKSVSPTDSIQKAHDWGYVAASQARSVLGISHDDPIGRAEFFKKIGFDPKASPDIGSPVSTVFPIQAAMARKKQTMKLALSTGTDKEFSAARAAFLAWTGSETSSRLVTTARTRQQRASRAFAAELLAPAAFLKKRLGKERDVSPFTLDKISSEIGVASTIVRLQAENNHYKILEAA